MAATHYWIDRDSLTNPGSLYALTHRLNHAEEFMPNHAWVFGEGVMPMQNMYI
ncbi:hypothetical protein Pcaca01_01580 [Pectobacterium carotovorum subsp. carotovorum]|nr:hypothetical protein Pcaca01_01580 [Pectobacterium carotovorum subsp. carotovorum]